MFRHQVSKTYHMTEGEIVDKLCHKPFEVGQAVYHCKRTATDVCFIPMRSQIMRNSFAPVVTCSLSSSSGGTDVTMSFSLRRLDKIVHFFVLGVFSAFELLLLYFAFFCQPDAILLAVLLPLLLGLYEAFFYFIFRRSCRNAIRVMEDLLLR